MSVTDPDRMFERAIPGSTESARAVVLAFLERDGNVSDGYVHLLSLDFEDDKLEAFFVAMNATIDGWYKRNGKVRPGPENQGE